jgi:hypothetical protein
MTSEIFQAVLGWSAVINMGLLTGWFLVIAFAGDWVYQLHSKFFKLTEEHFNALHYAGMMVYKITIWMFFIAPYIALRIAA